MKRMGIGHLLTLALVSLGIAVGFIGGSAAAPATHQITGTISQAALGTGFTYQGYLTENGVPINGQQCDAQFGLWDAESGGTQLGSTETVANLDATNGYFAVELNDTGEFGATDFDGQARYLEIAVRCSAGSGEFTVLGRQALTAVPYATHAENGVPSGLFILSSSATAPSGYTYSGLQVSPDQNWLTKTPMPTARSDFAAAAVNNTIYAIGGINGSAYLATVEEYDVTSNTWLAKAPMPTARSSLAVVAVNNKIYAIGGVINSNSYLATVEEYDVASNTWLAKAPMPTARTFLAAAAINNTIYAIGGSSGGILATVEAYDVASNTWSAKTNLPTARRALAAAVVNNKIYAIGGLNSSGVLATVEAYDVASNTWSAKTDMTTARTFLAAAAVNNTIYAIGGFNSGYLARVEAYTPLDALYLHQKN